MADIKVRIGQQNAVKVISSVTGSFVGVAGYAVSAGIATYANYANFAGIATYANYAGIASYANFAGISTFAINISGGSTNNLIYQSSSGVTTFVPSGSFGQILYVDVNGAPRWTFQPPRDAIEGITVINQDEIVGIANSITVLRIIGTGLTASLGVNSYTANIELIEIDGGEY